ncbi:MAG: IS1634 family transposase [Bacteroidetes bacterium]|nr:IS1634 family transposase [Bacteroidota bacterium]
MHLSYSTSKYKGKIYKSYSIAESYRDGKTVKKRTIWPIGKLTHDQADQIKAICKAIKSKEQFAAQFRNVVVKETRAYLDIALVNELWNHWRLDDAFDFDITDSPLSTPLIAKILTINRCTNPCSHYSIPAWAKKNALADVLEMDLSGLNDDKIYYELDKIHNNKISIENHLFKQTYSKNGGSYDFINYDLTTSYFVGYKCNLSAFGKGKVECHGRRQVLLGVLINDEGYPFKWDVFPGNTAEVKTLKQNINACKTRFKLKNSNVTLVFDRGIISDDNAELITDAEMKYISALDRNQISPSGIDLTPFKGLGIEKETKAMPKPKGFIKYDDDLYFIDNGVIGDKRLITGFNPVLFKEDRINRREKLDFFTAYLKKENKKLQKAQRDRKLDATRNRIINELKRLKIKKYYEDPVLQPITIQKKLKTGELKDIKSFKVKLQKKPEIISADMLLDGVCVFITNHVERQGRGYKVKPRKIIDAYRDKTKIEDVFKNMKSFLKLRPFFVNTNNHVKAVYTICIISYLLNKYLANQRKAAGDKDYLNSKELYAPFKDIDYVTLEDKSTGSRVRKSAELPADTQKLLQKIGLLHVADTQKE